MDFEEKLSGPIKTLIQQAKRRMQDVPIPKKEESFYSQPDYDYEDDQQTLLDEREEREFMKVQYDADFQDTIIYEREKEIKDIQVQMIQVNEIFKDLAKLVEDQGEMVDNIQTTIINTSANVAKATDEVKEADQIQQSTRTKYCYLAIIITVIAAILVGVVVLIVTLSKSGS